MRPRSNSFSCIQCGTECIDTVICNGCISIEKNGQRNDPESITEKQFAYLRFVLKQNGLLCIDDIHCLSSEYASKLIHDILNYLDGSSETLPDTIQKDKNAFICRDCGKEIENANHSWCDDCFDRKFHNGVTKKRCSGTTKENVQCLNVGRFDGEYCHIHAI